MKARILNPPSPVLGQPPSPPAVPELVPEDPTRGTCLNTGRRSSPPPPPLRTLCAMNLCFVDANRTEGNRTQMAHTHASHCNSTANVVVMYSGLHQAFVLNNAHKCCGSHCDTIVELQVENIYFFPLPLALALAGGASSSA